MDDQYFGSPPLVDWYYPKIIEIQFPALTFPIFLGYWSQLVVWA